MSSRSNINRYLPDFLKGCHEFLLLEESEDYELNMIWDELDRMRNNQFVSSSDDYGLSRLEKIFGVAANKKTETLTFRRDRLINRINLNPPFTLLFLSKQLDVAIGIGKYQVSVDYNNYALYLESSAADQAWFEEIAVMINQIKPANIVFINKPFSVDGVVVSENVNCSRVRYNYALGEWVLGASTIVEVSDTKTIKEGADMSIQNALLDIFSAGARDSIKKVMVNDQLEINDFILKESKDGNTSMEYMVGVSNLEGSVITNLKLLDATGSVLSSSNVYVPVQSDTLFKHIIQTKEGV